MNTGKYIHELLYQYDCVIIPGFGGFVMNRLPARIDTVKQIFYPPSKAIAFNRLLKNNDGLLVNYFSRRNNIPYANALEQVNEFAVHCNNILEQGFRLEISNVGVLFSDREKNIQFEPDAVNYLPDSFGLDSFHAVPVTGRHLLKRKTTVKSLPPDVVLHRRKGMIAAAVYTIFGMIIMISLLYFSIKEPWYDNFLSNYTSLNLFKETRFYFPRNDVQPFAAKDLNLQNSSGFVITDNVESMLSKLLLDSSGMKSKAEGKLSPTGMEKSYSSDERETGVRDDSEQEESKGRKYFVIGGCFKIKENAERFIRKMTRKGYNAGIVDCTRGGLYRVCYSKYSSRNEAITSMNEIRSTLNKDAWLLII